LARTQQQGGDTDSTLTDDQSEEYDDIEIIDESFGDNIGRSIEEVLKWVEDAQCSSRAPYHGSSRRKKLTRNGVSIPQKILRKSQHFFPSNPLNYSQIPTLFAKQ
jgi:hypothetical protein